MHTDNLRKLALETNDGVLRGPAFDAADEIDRLRAEIERLGRELNLAKYGEPDFSWSIHKKAMEDLLARAEKAEAKITQLRFEIEKLREDYTELLGSNEALTFKLVDAEAERDEARAQVAAAYEVVAIRSENYACGAPYNQRASINALANHLRGMTPDDAKAALEAYGREKVREGMQRAADLFPLGSRDGGSISSAILAEMETLK